MRTRQRRKRKGEGDKEEDDEERNSDEEEVPVSLLQQFGERVSHKHYGKHLLSVGDLDNIDVALFVVAASCIKKAIKRWKTSQLPVKAEEEGEAGDEPHAQQHSPRARRQIAGGRRKKTPRQSQSLPSTRPETATLLATASSIKKGETMEDTIRMLAAYADAIVLRHPEEGSAARAAAVVDSRVDATGICCVFNAGDGAGEHPTQALLDIFTIAELFPEWWAEQLQRLNTKDEQQEHLPDEKEKSEESSDALKENKGADVMQQEREEAGAMDNQHQQQTAFSSAKEEGTSISEDQQTGGLFQKMEEAGRDANAAAEAAAAAAAAVQSSGSSSSQDVTASDTTPTAAAEEKPPGPRKLTVAFVGDLKHGRTVHSLALVLSKFNCRIIALSSTKLRLPDALENTITNNFTAQLWIVMYWESTHTTNFQAQGGDGRGRLVHGTDFAETIRAADVLYMTRMQTERSVNPVAGESLSTQAQHSFVLTKTLLEANAKPHVKVLHPLPRVNEIDTAVDTTPFCAYFTQAENGLYMRMALLAVALNPYAWQLLFGV